MFILGQKLLFFVILHNFCVFSSSSSSHFAEVYPASNETISCGFYSTTNVTNGSLQNDKSWWHNGLRYDLGFYAKYDYILSDDGNKSPVPEHIRGCICLIKPCVNACCESRQMTDKKTGSCVSEEFDQLWWNVGLEGEDLVNTDVLETFHWFLRRPTCTLKHFLDPDENDYDEWYLAENGSIYVPDDNSFLDYDLHCVAVDKEKQVLLVLRCAEPEKTDKRFQMLGIGMLLSVPFLLATFIVYAVIPELRNVHGMSLMSYVGGLTVGYTFLGTVQIITTQDKCHSGSESCINQTFCTFSGYIIYFSFMLSFFWLNTMCFDIFWTFRGVRGSSSAKKNFILYCIYAWGMASFLTLLALSLDLSGISDKYKPGMYYTQTCFLQNNNKIVEFLYLYMILLILICSNITFFVMTAYRIRKVQLETAAVVDAGNSSRHTRHNYDNYRFLLYLRLFIIMGVTWSMELISWFISEHSVWFYFTDLLNCLQGVLIFLLVVCNDKVRKFVVKRYYTFRGTTPPKTGTTISYTGNSHFSSSYNQTNNIELEQRNALLVNENKDTKK